MDLPAVENPPQWDQVQHEVLCPLCDYNLRGLIQPRCPECGLAFDWNEVLDPARIRHPYLFEHHPRRRIWSFVMTLFHGLKPARFWTTLRPTHSTYPRKIFLYWLILTMLVLAGPATIAGNFVWQQVQSFSQVRAQYVKRLNAGLAPQQLASIRAQWGSVEAFADHQLGRPPMWWYVQNAFRFALSGLLAPILACVIWPWLTLAALLIFQQSMHRAKIRPAHVMRCAIYACDGFWLIVLIVWGLQAAPSWPSRLLFWFHLTLTDLLIPLALLYPAWCIWRLRTAYRRYLQFPHPLATVLASQIIVGLLAAIIILNL
jgi:hypothetical protein